MAKMEAKTVEGSKSILAAQTFPLAAQKVGPFPVKFGEHAVAYANPKDFTSGAKGFGCYGKVVIDGHTYQVACNLILIA